MTTAVNSRSLRRRTVLAMVAATLGCADARAYAPGNLVDLSVVDRETGQELQVWRHRGRLFVAGEPGARYSLRVANNTSGRLLVVMSVDGVNVLTGQTAGYGQRGYVFDPYQSYDVSGWRKSDTEVAAFTFAPLPDSYAARTGRPLDVGVIGLAVFTERNAIQNQASPWPEARARRESEADARGPGRPPALAPESSADRAQGAVAAQRREDKLGTAHGAREWSQVTSVPFQRATRQPQLIRRIEYDTYDRLAALGVVPEWREPGRRPRPFPGGGGYVPDPPGGY